MKGNNGTGNIIERDDWQTPNWLFDLLHKQYSFDFDCCATTINSKCSERSLNFLYEQPIEKVSWMNPPFSKPREMFEKFFKVVKKGVAIYRCDNMETKIWQDIILKKADWIFIPNKRWAYEGKAGKGSRFPSALIGIGVEPPTGLDGHTLSNTIKNNSPSTSEEGDSSVLSPEDSGNGMPSSGDAKEKQE